MNQSSITFNTVIEQWLAGKQPELSATSYNKYEQLYRNHIEPFFTGIECAQLSDHTLMEFYQQVTGYDITEPEHLSTGNMRTIFMILNNSLKLAYDKQYISECLYLKPSLKKEKHIVKTLSSANQKTLEAHIFANRNLNSLAILLALYSGIRLGELCALRWRDVDLINASLHITSTAQRIKVRNDKKYSGTRLVVLPPKSSTSYRLIPIPEFVVEYMKSFYIEAKKDYYIFSDSPQKPLEPRTLQYAYREILESNGISYLNFHCLRHTFATRCIMLGWDIKTLSEVLGHSDINVTMEYYFHSSFEHKKQQMNKLECLI